MPQGVLFEFGTGSWVMSAPEERMHSKTVAAVLADIDFSCRILAAALDGRSGNGAGAYASLLLLLYRRMLEDEWCPFYVERMRFTLSIENQVRAFALGSVRCALDHSECNQSRCVQDRANGGYNPVHCVAGCECGLIRPPMENMIQVLKNGDIPVLALSDEEDDASKMRVYAAKDCSYVAISHVWADGLGNPEENAILRCQARRLHRHRLSYMEGGEDLEHTRRI
ncbi:hypothetical protein BU16DRAFT_119704 [Lophium mytilinum]|uniref:Uncharacterized protein n=1 Tax=Lophium mytilinum TaxID=390894 RepID=A0A6A6QH15_9PEZI|nr:hypothetical protein BU16DRAFT_119704 [Lophium mytilinum]